MMVLLFVFSTMTMQIYNYVVPNRDTSERKKEFILIFRAPERFNEVKS